MCFSLHHEDPPGLHTACCCTPLSSRTSGKNVEVYKDWDKWLELFHYFYLELVALQTLFNILHSLSPSALASTFYSLGKFQFLKLKSALATFVNMIFSPIQCLKLLLASVVSSQRTKGEYIFCCTRLYLYDFHVISTHWLSDSLTVNRKRLQM